MTNSTGRAKGSFLPSSPTSSHDSFSERLGKESWAHWTAFCSNSKQFKIKLSLRQTGRRAYWTIQHDLKKFISTWKQQGCYENWQVTKYEYEFRRSYEPQKEYIFAYFYKSFINSLIQWSKIEAECLSLNFSPTSCFFPHELSTKAIFFVL